MNWSDQISATLRQLTDFFGATHPIRVGIGVCLGIVMKGFVIVLSSAWPDLLWIKTAADLHAVYFVAGTLVATFVPLAFGRRGAPESAVNQIRTIQAMMDAAQYSANKRAIIWQALIRKYLDAAKPDLSSPPSTTDLLKETEREIGDASPS